MKFLIAASFVLAVIGWLAYHAFRWNMVRCASCDDELRERYALDHGGDPSAYTHYGICADRHAKVHAQMHYGDTQ